jgi:hypothetical protein
MNNSSNTSDETELQETSGSLSYPGDVTKKTSSIYFRELEVTSEKLSTRITVDQYHHETSPVQRQQLQREIAATLTDELLDGRVIELYRLGALSLYKKTATKQEVANGRSLTLEEDWLIADFEKCLEITADHRQRWPELTTISELARLVHNRLQPLTGWSERESKRFVKGFFLALSLELVDFGHSDALSEIGTFFCIPQSGAGLLADQVLRSDIFLQSARLSTTKQALVSWEKTKISTNSWEPLIEKYGEPLWNGKFHLLPELVCMGYSKEALLREVPKHHLEVSLALFTYKAAGKTSFVLCSDGLRYLTFETEPAAIGTELIVCLNDSEAGEIENPSDGSILEISWLRRVLALSWVLLQSNKEKKLRIGAVISNDTPIDVLSPALRSKPAASALLVNDFSEIPHPICTADGLFHYVTLVGLNQNEVSQFKAMPNSLKTLLNRKGWDQSFRRFRPSLPSFASNGYVV